MLLISEVIIISISGSQQATRDDVDEQGDCDDHTTDG